MFRLLPKIIVVTIHQ